MQYEKFNEVMEKKLEDILSNIDMQKKIFIWGYGEGERLYTICLGKKGLCDLGLLTVFMKIKVWK